MDFKSPQTLVFEFAENSMVSTERKSKCCQSEKKNAVGCGTFLILFLNHCCLTDWTLLTTRSPVLKELRFACQQILDECQRYNFTCANSI